MLRPFIGLWPLCLVACASPSPPPNTPADASVCDVRFVDSATLTLNPSDAREVIARVTPGSGREVRFGIVGSGLDASLDRTSASPDPEGNVRFTLTAPTSTASFQIRASADCGAEALLGVTVDANGTGSVEASAIYGGTRGPSMITVDLLRSADCDAQGTATVERTAMIPSPGGTVQFSGLLAASVYSLRGTATGPTRTVLADACSGPFQVTAGERMPVALRFTDRASTLGAAYTLSIRFDLDPLTTPSAASWLEAPRREISTRGGEAQTLLPELAEAVARSVPTELAAAARATLRAALEGEVGARLDAALEGRGLGFERSLQRLATETARGLSRVHASAMLVAPIDDGAAWSVRGVALRLDPGTPEVDLDDATVTLDESASGRLARSGGEAVVGSISGFPLPFARAARRTLSAVVRRFGASSTGEYLALAACPLVAETVRSVAALCDERCVRAACRETADRVGRAFDEATARVESERALVDLRFTAAGVVAPGTLRVARVDAVASGSYRDAPTPSLMATTVLTTPP